MTLFVLFAACWIPACGGCDPVDPPGMLNKCTSVDDCAEGEVCWAGECQTPPGHQGPGQVTIPDAGGVNGSSVAADAGETIPEGPDSGHGGESDVDAGVPDSSGGADAGFSDHADAGIGSGGLEWPDGGIAGEECTADFHCFGYIPCGNDPTCFSPVRCDYLTNVCVLNDCIDDNDCAEGYLCSAGQCVYAGCRDNFDCNFGFEICDLETRQCVATEATGCTQNRDCNELSEHCDLSTGSCLPGRRCAWDANCGENQWCGGTGYCEPLRECVTTLNCAVGEICLPGEGSSLGGFCRQQSVFCSNNSHCLENQHCDIFSGRCVRSGSCGNDDDYCGLSAGHACNPVGNSGTGSCTYANVPCSSDLNCLGYEECRYVWPGKDAGAPKRCVPRNSCIFDPNLCTPDETCTAEGNCIAMVTDETCENDGDCDVNGFQDFICARTDNASSTGTCVERAGGGECNGPEDCLTEEFCVVETGHCIADPTINDPTDCTDDPGVCTTPSGCPGSGGACVCNTETGQCMELAGAGGCELDTDCFDDEVCDVVSQTCKELAQVVGGECASDVECEAGYVCDLEDSAGTCVLLASSGCDGDADCGGSGEYCDTTQIPSRCAALGDPPCGTDQECLDALGTNAICQFDNEGGSACTLLAGGSCCTNQTNDGPDGSICRADEVCSANGTDPENCLFVCKPLNQEGCTTNDDCVCENCSEQEVCDLTQPGPGGQGGTCVRVSGSDEGGCEISEDCRFEEVCVIGDDGERFCLDEGETIDCSVDIDVCAEGSEVCANVCDGEDCSWTCVLAQGGGGCKTTADCRTGEACVLPDGVPCGPDEGSCGTCENLYACDENADCGADSACDVEVGECFLLGSVCGEDADPADDCGSDEVCDEDEGLCKVTGGPCGADIDCPGIDGYCDLNSGTCKIGNLCSVNSDCDYHPSNNAGGTLCDFAIGSCRSQTPECYIDAHCIGGQVCCTEADGCAFNKCYFKTPTCIDWEGGSLAQACDAHPVGCNASTGYCSECDTDNDICGIDYCYVDLGICVDFEQ